MFSVLGGVMLALLLRFPLVALQSALHGLEIFSKSVLPLLFPYMVFCQMTGDALARNRLMPPALPCALLSLLGGSPTGARLSAALYRRGRLTRRQLHALCALCGTVSPIFITGTLQTWAGARGFGCCVLLSHWMSAAVCAMFVYALPHQSAEPPLPHALQDVPESLRLPDAIAQSAQAMLSVGGSIVLFSVLAAMPGAVFPAISPPVRAAIHALLEMAGGSRALIALPLPPALQCCAVSACISFGGLSILMQNLTFLRPLGVTAGKLLAFRCVHALLAAAICRLLFPFLG